MVCPARRGVFGMGPHRCFRLLEAPAGGGIPACVELLKGVRQLAHPDWDTIEEDGPAQPFRMAGGVERHDRGSPGVGQCIQRLQLEVPPDRFQVIGEARRLESGRVVNQGGAAGAALIVEEERMAPGRERIQLVPEILRSSIPGRRG